MGAQKYGSNFLSSARRFSSVRAGVGGAQAPPPPVSHMRDYGLHTVNKVKNIAPRALRRRDRRRQKAHFAAPEGLL